MRRFLSSVDFSVLVDVLSNVAGMMLLLACIALLMRQAKLSDLKGDQPIAKPISFPLAYIPDKRSITIVLKFGRLYRLPEAEAMTAVTAKVSQGQPVSFLELNKDGVDTRVEVTPTATGYRFMFKMQPNGGIPLDAPQQVTRMLAKMVKQYPPDRFFFVVHSWPDTMNSFRDIREYLHEQNVEVGWMPHSADEDDQYDIAYSIGEYDKSLTSIKAQ